LEIDVKIQILLVPALALSACGSNVQPAVQAGATGAGGASAATGTTTTTGTTASTGTGAATGTGGGSGGGAVCGGLKGLPCAADEWCDYPNDDCGGDDDTGVCRPRPTSCPTPPPVSTCGCDGHAYASACDAEQAGVDVSANGSCAGSSSSSVSSSSSSGGTSFACGTVSCQAGVEYCDVAEGFVEAYACKKLPASCLPPNAADCSCMPIQPDCGSCTGTTGQVTEYHGCG